MPATLTAPAETRPARSAAQVAGQALVARLLGPGAGEVVVAADQPGDRADDGRGGRACPAGAPSTAVTVADAASAGPPSRVTGRPA